MPKGSRFQLERRRSSSGSIQFVRSGAGHLISMRVQSLPMLQCNEQRCGDARQASPGPRTNNSSPTTIVAVRRHKSENPTSMGMRRRHSLRFRGRHLFAPWISHLIKNVPEIRLPSMDLMSALSALFLQRHRRPLGFEACGGGNAVRAIKRRLQGENNRRAGFIPPPVRLGGKPKSHSRHSLTSKLSPALDRKMAAGEHRPVLVPRRKPGRKEGTR